MESNDAFFQQLEALLSELKARYAPDPRLHIFEIGARMEGESLILEGETDCHEANVALIDFLQEQQVEDYQDRIRLLPETLTGEYLRAVPLSGYIPLRKEPRHQAEMVNQAQMGEKLRILKSAKEGQWLLCKTPDGYLAWAPAENLIRFSQKEEKAWDRQDKLLITAWRTALRPTPGQPEKAFMELSFGAIVTLLGYYSGCWQVELPDGQMGFVPYDQAARLHHQPPPTPENILTTARRFLGLPYIWGGRSPYGVDCSGYIQLVFGFHGMGLPRDADQQMALGQEIAESPNDFAGFLPGDLLFMGNTTTRKATHVGISLGADQFLHASAWVRQNSLSPKAKNYAPERAQTFLAARRVCPEE